MVVLYHVRYLLLYVIIGSAVLCDKAVCSRSVQDKGMAELYHVRYFLLYVGKPVAANCKCPAGETQTYVHVAALLITLTEITPQARTSMRCAWSRPTQGGKPSFASGLDFGKSSVVGYVTYTGSVL